MLKYALIVGALFVGCLGASKLGLHLLGVALFPIPIAVCVVRRQWGRTLGLLVCAALAVWLGDGTIIGVVLYTLLAGVGVPLGLGIALRWTYGWTVTAVAALVYTALAGAFLLTWPDWLAQSQVAWDVLLKQLKDNPPDTGGESAAAIVTAVTWMKDHWADVGLGLWMWPALVAACVGVSAVSARLRRRWRIEGVRGSFGDMRPSEWLVWAAILAALLCFADYRWPSLGLRVVSWNSAIALAAIYWLNGFSIFVFALDMLRPHFLLVMSLVFLFVWAMPHPLLCAVGLFDTWADFRGRLRRVAAARKQREESDDVK